MNTILESTGSLLAELTASMEGEVAVGELITLVGGEFVGETFVGEEFVGTGALVGCKFVFVGRTLVGCEFVVGEVFVGTGAMVGCE